MKYILILLVALAFVGCDAKSEIAALSAMSGNEKVWIFAQFNVREEKDGLESYYYYGKVSKSLYEAISRNNINKGFVLLEDAKYWGNNDLIYEYKDIENSGDIVFRIENIAKINLVNIEPIVGKGLEQFKERPDKKALPLKNSSVIEKSPNKAGKGIP